MLPKKNRFSSQDLANKSLFKNSKKIYTEYGFFVVLEKHPLAPSLKKRGGSAKKGIVLSKKSFKTAALRNKYKRLFYNTILEIQNENKIENKTENTEKSFIFHPKKVFTKVELKLDLLKIML